MKYGSFRIAAQAAVFFLMFVIPLLNIYELYFVSGTYYALNVGGLGVADPVVILQAMFASGQLTLPLLSAAVFPILVALIMGRFWCRMFCPTGTLLSLIRTPYTLHVESTNKNPTSPCCKENSCSGVCPMGLQPYRESRDLLCVNCGQCIDACKHNRLRFHGMGSA